MYPPNPRRSLPMALLRAREAVMRQFRPMLGARNVTEQQWRVLRVLHDSGPLDASEVADRAMILAPSLTRILRTLEDRGLITRRKAEGDGRRLLLAISAGGTVLIEDAAMEQRQIYGEIVARFGESRIEQILDLLEALSESQEGARPGKDT